jgi:hypothetical protein
MLCVTGTAYSCTSLPRFGVEIFLADFRKMLGFSGNPVNRCENPFTERKGLKFQHFLVACRDHNGPFHTAASGAGRSKSNFR